MVLWSYGPMVLWSYGPMVLWSYGPMVLWSYGPMVLWSYGPMVLQGRLPEPQGKTSFFALPRNQGTRTFISIGPQGLSAALPRFSERSVTRLSLL
ncbi:hypothetical protein C9I89_14310 [Photobacterium lipolyticum]|uniref:Uncharacterized protein n=1 Tax=Photobacterium lipolyticum TaxID=266810 RepID=A0A2T3MW04_9GAMM|nr:hypothetical protein C9I89_14310 [Photobacterium lipolyticum]